MWLELSEQGRRGQGRWHRILGVTGRTWAFTPMSREPWRAAGGRGTDLTQAHRRPLAAAGDRPVGDLSRSWGGAWRVQCRRQRWVGPGSPEGHKMGMSSELLLEEQELSFGWAGSRDLWGPRKCPGGGSGCTGLGLQRERAPRLEFAARGPEWPAGKLCVLTA